MTVKEYAKHRGVSRPTVYAWIRKGLIVKVDGKIDPKQADAAIDGTAQTPEPAEPAVVSAPEEMTIAEYAKHRGVHRQTIYEALRAGTIERTPSKKLNVRACDQAWRVKVEAVDAKPKPKKPKAAPIGVFKGEDDEDDEDGDRLSYAAERARHEHYKANLAELKFREAAGDLLPLEKVNALTFEALRTARARLEGLPAKLAPRLCGETDLHTIQELMTSGIHAVLTRLAEDIDRIKVENEQTD